MKRTLTNRMTRIPMVVLILEVVMPIAFEMGYADVGSVSGSDLVDAIGYDSDRATQMQDFYDNGDMATTNVTRGTWFGCRPNVLITHSPVVAKYSETVTFEAELKSSCGRPTTVDIIVNGWDVETCAGMSVGDVCSYTGGPYHDHLHWLVSYKAVATDDSGRSRETGYYQFGVTDDSYNFRPLGFEFEWLPARLTGTWAQKTDFVFHRSTDYASFGDFVDEVGDKMNHVYGQQEIIEIPYYFDNFNFYVYTKTAVDEAVSGRSCVNEVHADADADMSWRDVDAILHTANLTDCTIYPSVPLLSAEGWNTKAFLHESGHAVFDLADEYDDAGRRCLTSYFESANEPNIFSSEARCRAEQIRKGRDPDECWEFTTCDGGWWGIHDLTVNTVMIWGDPGDPWGIEAEEHVWEHFLP